MSEPFLKRNPRAASEPRRRRKPKYLSEPIMSKTDYDKADAFLAKNINSYHEFLEERKHPKCIKPTIQDPVMRVILDFDEEKK